MSLFKEHKGLKPSVDKKCKIFQQSNFWTLLFKLLFSFTVLLFFTIKIFADSTEENYIFFYDKCSNRVINENYNYIENFWESFCSFLISTKWELFVLENAENDFWIEIFSDEIINYIKSKYYRWEFLMVKAKLWEEKVLENFGFKIWDKLFSTSKTAKIENIVFWSDTILQKYEVLSKNCAFDSFIPKCRDKYFEWLVSKIDFSYNKLFLTKEQLTPKTKNQLQKESEKIQNIKNKIDSLKGNYEKEEKIFFTIEYISYKLTLYNSIIKSIIEDKNFEEVLVKKEKEIKWIFVKELLKNFTVRQNDLYTYFYYKDKLAHTVENNLETLSVQTKEQNKKSLWDKDFLKQKIIDEYNASFLKVSQEEVIYLSRINWDFAYILDTKTLKKFKTLWTITKTEKGRKWYYLLTFWLSLDLYDGKDLQNIVKSWDWKFVNDFELLSWWVVKVTFQDDYGKTFSESYDVNNL